MAKEGSIRVGIIGTGVGIRTLVPGFRSTGRADIVGISGSGPSRAKECADAVGIPIAFDNYRDLIDCKEIDLVCVASPNKFHFEQAAYAIRAGKPVLVEKPLGTSMRETELLADSLTGRKQLAIVDHQLRFNPYLRSIRSLIRSRTLGEPYFIRIHQQGTGFSNRNAKWNWSFDEREGGGVLLAMGSHLIDLLWFWLGNRKVFSVDCVIDPVVMERIDGSGAARVVTASSFFAAQLALGSWCTAHLSASAAALGDTRFDIDIYGSDGELHFDLRDKLRLSVLDSVGRTEPVAVEGVTEEERLNKVSLFKGSFVYFAPRIVDAVSTGELSPLEGAATFADALATQRVLDALRAAAVQGYSVQLESGYTSRASI